MPTLALSAEDADDLRAILENYFSELRMEIERTERGEFRAMLQKREQLVKKLIEQLKA
jgi:hypothetical protein